MQLRELRIERFRGIRQCTWRPSSPVVCFIGPGDSTKTTILDALELVLGSRWAVAVTPTDFNGGETDEPIVITATVGELPIPLLDDEKYGLEIRGWDKDKGLHDEPEPSDEAVLTIVFSVDDSLEPSWKVVNDRRPEGRNIPSRDRELLGLVRLGGDIDRHLSWGRGSALTRNTDDLKEVNRVIVSAQREARDAVAAAPLEKLKAAATKAQTAAQKLGVKIDTDYRPALEPSAVSVGVGQLTLHHGEIPVRAAGLGSRRLNALALQTLSVESGAVLLIDEVEHGLEPHRLRHLLRELQKAPGTTGQVLLTTHSEIPLEELTSNLLYVVRCEDGTTKINCVGKGLQNVARSNPEALLARRVLVCEGPTEVGLCNGLRDVWAANNDDVPVACTGATFASGGGSNTGKRAAALNALGYTTAVIADADRTLKPTAEELQAAGVDVFLWPGKMCTERRVALDLPWEHFEMMVALAIASMGEVSVRDAIRQRLPNTPRLVGADASEWLKAGVTEGDMRRAVGDAAHANDWFKDITRGEALGELIGGALPEIEQTPTGRTLKMVADWVYGES